MVQEWRKDALETMSTGLAVAMTTVMNPQRDKFLSDHSNLLAHLDSDLNMKNWLKCLKHGRLLSNCNAYRKMESII